MEKAAKRMCGGESWAVIDTDGREDNGKEDEWEGGWVLTEMEVLEERGGG